MSLYLLMLACLAADMEPAANEQGAAEMPDRFMEMKAMPASPAGGAAMMDDVADAEEMEESEPEGRGRGPGRAKRESAGKKDKDQADDTKGGDDGAAAATRSWFPETFLWAPAVITDASGRASVDVTLPDSLTTWRVLGLASGAGGAQAGAVATVDTRLPIYTEPRLPAFLRQGDRVQVPIQVFNTTAAPHEGELAVRATGLQGGAAGTVRVPAGGRRLERAELSAPAPGDAVVEVALAGADAVVRTVPVLPRGRRSAAERSGVLGASEAVTLSGPAAATFARVRLTLYPGPLGVLRDALDSARLSSTGDRIFAFALATRGGAALEALGAQPDAEALRALRLQANQGLVRGVTTGDIHQQLDLAAGLAQSAGDPVAERIYTWARDEALQAQLPDGTWAVPSGSSVQQLLALTARAADVLGDERARVTASGAFERNAAFLLNEETTDAYTAALVLNSGACPPELEADLRALVEGALKRGEDGLWTVTLPEGVVRYDRAPVSEAERLAAAARALEGSDRARDLLASLVARYSPASGFGDARAGLAALSAFEALAAAPPAGALEVSLTMDGEELGRKALNPTALDETATLIVPVPVGSHAFEVVSDGAWPGLAWHLELESWAPWGGGVSRSGLEVQVETGALSAGREVPVTVTASAPRDAWVEILQELPAGVVVDAASLPDGARSADGLVTARVKAGADGLATLRYTATPTFAGALWSGATEVSVGRDSAWSPPAVWAVQ
jgi:hypothetical protein